MVDQAQDTLRPNNRLSDMQATMEQTQAFENRVLERLNAGKTVRSFLITAVELLTEAVNLLVLQVFRKDDYAVKYAVEPLLDGDGPLGDLSVRLKLIYGLGVINRQEYEDAELLMALREELNHDGNEYAFTDEARALVGIFLNDQYVKGKAKKLTKDVETPKQAAVLGAGIMGGGIAYQSAWKGVPVVMKDINDKSLTLGMTEAAKLLNKQLERGKIDGLKLAGVISTIHPTLDYAGFDRVDVVVEAVVENPKVKKAVLAETEQKVRPDTVLASNTSTIPISELANALERPENFCGMHFFNPVHRMPLVEIIRGEKSSDETIAKVVAWASKMGKTPIVVNDCPGFFVNRVLFPYFAGFSQLLRDGADFRKIDKVMEKQFGWPMGPAYLLDVVGIDTAHHAQAVMAAGFPQRMQKDYRDAIDALFDANRFGQKNGLGFWRYKEDSKGKPKKEEDAAVEDLLAEVSQPKRDFSEEEIIARMMIPMVNEVVRCLEEGIIATPAEADMALVYGLGFPPFHGGAFRWLDTLGSAKYLDMAQQYQHLGPLYEVPEGLRNKARHNEPYYPPVEPARPVGDLKTA